MNWWIWVYAGAVGAWAFGCTRGWDGHPLVTLVGAVALGVIYWASLWRKGRVGVVRALKHLGLLEAAAIAGMVVRPELEELSGLLYFIIPLLVFGIVVGGVVVGLLHRMQAPGHCRQCGYDLTGNESGTCPECGTAVPEHATRPLAQPSTRPDPQPHSESHRPG